MANRALNSIAIVIARTTVCLALGYAGCEKMYNRQQFIESLAIYDFDSKLFAFVVNGLPAFEVSCAAAICFKKTRSTSLELSVLLFVTFSILHLMLWVTGDKTDCGCFGIGFLSANHAFGLLRACLLIVLGMLARFGTRN